MARGEKRQAHHHSHPGRAQQFFRPVQPRGSARLSRQKIRRPHRPRRRQRLRRVARTAAPRGAGGRVPPGRQVAACRGPHRGRGIFRSDGRTGFAGSRNRRSKALFRKPRKLREARGKKRRGSRVYPPRARRRRKAEEPSFPCRHSRLREKIRLIRRRPGPCRVASDALPEEGGYARTTCPIWKRRALCRQKRNRSISTAPISSRRDSSRRSPKVPEEAIFCGLFKK